MENKIMTEVNEKKVSGSSFDKKDRRGNKRRNSINNRGMGTVEMILIIVEKTLAENTYVLCGN